MPVKNIATNQKVTKEKLQRATPALAGGARAELRCEMTPAEKTAKRVGRTAGE